MPATSTSQPLTVVTATQVTQVGGVQQQPVQNVAGVSALPSTGEGSSNGGVSWLLVAAGAAILLAGLAGIASERRRA